jgi:hypothetical protein
MRASSEHYVLRALLLFSLLSTLGCARHYRQVRYPFTAEQLATWTGSKGEVLMTYLLQPNASVSVCDARSKGAHVSLSLKDDLADVVDGLGRGVDPPRWRKCVELLLPSLDPTGAQSFFAEMGRKYKSLLRDSDLEKNPHLPVRLDALHQIYLQRPVGYGADADTMKSLTDSLRKAVSGQHLSPAGLKYGTELLETLEIEAGTYKGAPVTAATLDALAAEHNETILERLARRLPDASLRTEALHRLVRLRIGASPFPEVQAQADEVEKTVVEQGFFPISIETHPIASAEMLKGLLTMRVAIFQNLWKQVAELLSEEPGKAPTNMPEQELRGSLAFTVQGISRPISLCGPKDAYDPSPCLPSSFVELTNPFVLLEQDGTMRFRENVREVDAFAIGAASERLNIPVVVGGKTFGTISWALHFLHPKDMIFAPKASGALGPTLTVDADNHLSPRVLYRIGSPMGEYLAVLEVADTPTFHVLAAGGEGYAGTDGARGPAGQDGMNGSSASCGGGGGTNGSDGGPGGRGGDGTEGGPGGHGGRVVVNIHCDAGSCGNLSRMLAEGIRAPGGKGGRGGAAGPGGRGGRGGSGGASASCTRQDGSVYTVAGGTSGSDGSAGPPGTAGRHGAPGLEGQVMVRTLPFTAAPRPRP